MRCVNLNKSVVGFSYERKVTALLLYEGLTVEFEIYLAGRVDCGDLLGLHIVEFAKFLKCTKYALLGEYLCWTVHKKLKC